MARRRMIDGDFWEEPKVAKMDDSHRLFILGCINEADDEGRLIAELPHLNSIIWKYHKKNIKWVQQIRDEVCNTLRGFQLYQAEGVEYIQLINWERYQILRKDRIKNSRYPAPPHNVNHLTVKSQPLDSQKSAQDKISKDKISKDNIYVQKFEEIYKDYPNKDSRKEAEKHYNASVKTEQAFENIKKALRNYLEHLKKNTWKPPKSAKTWFNNWQDWVDYKEPARKGEVV